MNKLDQVNYQFAKYLAKAQFIATMVNLNTDGRALVTFEPRYNRVELSFAPNLRQYDTRTQDVTGELIEFDEYIKRKEDKRFDEESNYRSVLRAIKALKNFISVAEQFLENQGDFGLENCKDVDWYMGTIKYRVYTLV